MIDMGKQKAILGMVQIDCSPKPPVVILVILRLWINPVVLKAPAPIFGIVYVIHVHASVYITHLYVYIYNIQFVGHATIFVVFLLVKA